MNSLSKRDTDLIAELRKLEPISMTNQIPVVWDEANGHLVYSGSNRFIDWTSTICVSNIGHCNSDVEEAIVRTLKNSPLHTYTFASNIRLRYLEKLTAFTGYEKAFLTSAGTEATEVACKIMKLYGKKRKRTTLVSFFGAMHGKTMLAEQLKGTIPSTDIVHLQVPTENEKFDRRNIPVTTCGVIIETYPGWSAKLYPKKYIRDLYAFCKANDILVCFDEIQAGFGRTGKLFGYEHYLDNYKPDLVCCGKALSNGMPLSAVLGKAELLDLPEDLSSTNSGHPLCCAAGLATIKYMIEENIIQRASSLHKIMFKNLHSLEKKYPKIIKEVNGVGMVWALICPDELTATKIVEACFKKGLLLIWTHKHSVKIAPPLTIDFFFIKEGIRILNEVCHEFITA